MIVLGINSVYHESAAALAIDGQVVAAAEEERFNRIKHGKEARVDNPQVLPTDAILYCLKAANVRPADLNAVAYSFSPELRTMAFREDPFSKEGNWGSRSGEDRFLSRLALMPEAVCEALQCDVREQFRWVPHHLAHAASSFYPSGFDEAAILVVDGIAENASTFLGVANQSAIVTLDELAYPHSLGFLWERITKFLGFTTYDASKVMGLAAFGNPAAFAEAFDEFAQVDAEGFTLDPTILRFRLDDCGPLEALLGPRRGQGEPIESQHADIAAALQRYTNHVLLAISRRLYRLHSSPRLCMAGGVALNCTSNWIIKERGPFRDVYIPPAPHDAGTATGAALAISCESLQDRRLTAAATPFVGPEFSDAEIMAAMHAEGVVGRCVPEIEAEVAKMLAAGMIVGWFQGRMELGPRALGNRSLLANPSDPCVREALNSKVKHREPFRPFAPSVLAEKCADWFELGRLSQGYDFMSFACPVRADKRACIPAVMHVDGTARIQVVTRQSNARFHRLISCFERLTGLPLILNTSFNDCEPMVCSPVDALRTFKITQIDALALGNILVHRQ